jgi:hypothetical protein
MSLSLMDNKVPSGVFDPCLSTFPPILIRDVRALVRRMCKTVISLLNSQTRIFLLLKIV